MLEKFLESLQPDQNALFSKIAEHITDDMLEEISRADYGNDADEHLAALRRLRDTGELAVPYHWYPFEVLELIRQDTIGNSTRWPKQRHEYGCWITVFASSALLRALGSPWNYNGDSAWSAYNLIRIVRNIADLPVPLGTETIRFIAWFMLRGDRACCDGQVVCFGVALLWLLLQAEQPPDDEELIRLSEWIVKLEEELHADQPSAFDRWLLAVTHDPPPSPWESLGADLRRLDLKSHRLQLREWVQLIGAELMGDSDGA